jgi:osmotically-inducible protein OsmY
MSVATLTPADVHLRDAVVRQLDWDPEVDASDVGVSARDGIVTLTGRVDSCLAKTSAERVVQRVRGVRGIANDLVVRVRSARTDTDLARDAADALRLRGGLRNRVQATVQNGQVTLTGSVAWLFEKRQAEDTVRNIHGVLGVLNHIGVKKTAAMHDLQRRIVGALHRNADVDAHHISVTVEDDTVILDGRVTSWMQREAAEHAAGSAPGITSVVNRIAIVPPEPAEQVDEIC